MASLPCGGGRIRTELLGLLLLGGLLLGALVLFSLTQSHRPSSFNSDDLYCPSVCEDVLQGRDLQGWHFTAVPYLFPDLLLLLPCQALCANLVMALLAYDLLFYLLLTAVLAWLVRSLALSWLRAWLTAGAGVLFLIAAHLDPASLARAGEMYQPGFHVGAILSGLLLTAAVLDGLRVGIRIRTAMVLLVAGPLAVFSDRLLLVQFLAPMLVTLGLLMVLRATPWRRGLVLGVLLAASVPLANGVRWCFVHLGFILMNGDSFYVVPNGDFIPLFFAHLFSGMPNLWLLPLHLLAGLAVAIYWLRKRQPTTYPPAETVEQAEPSEGPNRAAVLFLACVMISAPFSNVAAVLLHSLNYLDRSPHRYLWTCWLLPFLFVGLFVQLLPNWWRRLGTTCFAPAVMSFAVYQIAAHAGTLQTRPLELPYPPLAQTLDRLERERGPLRGLAGYWTARRMDFLTRQRIWVRPAVREGYPSFHAYNPNRFLSDDPADLTLPRYNFIIVSTTNQNDLHEEDVRSEFGEPSERIKVEGDEVWLYERLSSPRFDRFLEAQLAQRLCRRAPYLTPVSPQALSIAKPNRMPWWSARNLQPQSGEEVEIRFAHPVSGGLIDVAAHFVDEYSLDFYRGEQLLGTLQVPNVPWTGFMIFYPPPGMQSRLLRVPEPLRTRAWDRVVVRAAGSSSERSLGHFLVFGEDVAQRVGCPQP